MKLTEIRVDAETVEHGRWVGEKYGTPIPELGDICLKVRGANNRDWRRLQARLIEAVPRKKRIAGRIDPDEADRITAILLRDAGLLDWENVAGDDDKPVQYSKEMAGSLLADPNYARFRDGALWACSVVAEQAAEDVEDAAKN